MRRRKKQSKRRTAAVVAAVLFFAFVGHIAIDQFMLFTRYHEELAAQDTEIARLESEIAELENDLEEVDTFPFIMKYALKYGLRPTGATPVPVDLNKPEDPDTDLTHEEER